MQEGFKSGTNSSDKFNQLLNEYTIEDQTDVIKLLEILAEKINQLENKGNNFSGNKILPGFKADNLNCRFKDSCYTAKYSMGSCPCELVE